LPRMRNRNQDGGSQLSMNSAGSSDNYDRLDSRDRNNGNTSQKIRSHHETLMRENEKLTRQLYQQTRTEPPGGQMNEKRVYVIDEEPVNSAPAPRRVYRAYRPEPDEEIVELIRRPSYATRYRTTRSRQVDEVSPQRRTAVVRRVADSDVIEVRR